MYPIETIVKFFLSKSSMSPKKLQKLLYYAYAWTIALLNDSIDELTHKLFSERIEAWVHGPVVPVIYVQYKEYGWNDIPKIDCFDEKVFSMEVLNILHQVWDVYGGLTGNDLEAISHKEEPWLKARNGIPAYESSDALISDRDIFSYFNEQAHR